MGLFTRKISSRTRERLFRDVCSRFSEKESIVSYTGNQEEDFAIGYFSKPTHQLFEFKSHDLKDNSSLENRLIVIRGELSSNPTFCEDNPENVLAAFFGTNLPDSIRKLYANIASQNEVVFGGYACRGTGAGPTWMKFYLSKEIDSTNDWEKKVDNFYNALVEMNRATRGTQIQPDEEKYRHLKLESYHH